MFILYPLLLYGANDLYPSAQTLRAYDNTSRDVMGTLMPDIQVGLVTFSTLFQVLKVPIPLNLATINP